MDPMDPMNGFYPHGHPQQHPYSPMGGSAQSPGGQSPGSPGSGAGTPPGGRKAHSRTYQACEPCRKRKVKCDMGDVENPHDPPCARCRRERAECYLSETRRKKRSRSEAADRNDSVPPNANGESSRTNGRDVKRPRVDGANNRPRPASAYPTGQATAGSPRPPQYHAPSPPFFDPATVAQAESHLKYETYDTQDTLGRLLDASKVLEQAHANHFNMHTTQAMAGGLTGLNWQVKAPEFSEESKNEAARKHWSRNHYVRAGLITAEEGMAYINYFYTNCMPFTPITIPDYRDPATHETLLEREPFLFMVIMTIASRFMELADTPGSGPVSRPQQIHHEFFDHTKEMLLDIVLARQQYGGGFTGGGKAKAKTTDPLHRYGLRSITTVEAFLLLCEWAPRALHFPPTRQIELMVPLDPLKDEQQEDGYRMLNGEGNKRRNSWLEPAWRCDTMIWLLQHIAMGLAVEVGLFDNRTEDELKASISGVPDHEIHDYQVRKIRTRDVFGVTYVQTCGRLELIGKVPPNLLESLNFGIADHRISDAVAKLKLQYETGLTQQYFPMINASSSPYVQSEQDAIWFFWQEITAIMKSGNQNMFPRKDKTRAITHSGEYRKWISVYAPLLNEWREEFDKCGLIQEPMRTILLIEYEYVRIYIHSLPLQAFVERAVASTPSKQHLDTFGAHGTARNDSVANEGGQGIPMSEVRKWMAKDGPYIDTLVSACQHVLELVAESKIPEAKLKHFTVRVYFRIMASAVHLLKDYDMVTLDYVYPALLDADFNDQTFVAGAYEHNLKRSFELLRKAANVLQNRIVDDVHIGRTFAAMITRVSSQLEKRLTRFVPSSGPGQSRAQSATPVLAHSPALGGSATPRPQFMAQHQPPNLNWNPPMTNGSLNTPNLEFTNWSTNTPAFLSTANLYDESQTVMPPPHTFSPEFTNGDAGLGSSDTNWFAVDLQPMIGSSMNNSNNDVGSSHYGPTVGGGDMLDPYMEDPAYTIPFGPTEQGWHPQ